MRGAIIGALLTLAALCAHAQQHGDYRITRDAGGLQIASERYGAWRGAGLLSSPGGAEHQTLRLEFEARDYFIAGNKGHFAIGLQGQWGPGLHGRGVIIGNVSELPQRGRCAPTDPGHRIAIEGFYGAANCVLGSSTASIPLMDGERYRLEVSVRGRLVTYQLDQRVGTRWQAVSQATVYDPDGPEQAGGQWWLTEVYSRPGWEMQLLDVTEGG